MQRELIQLCAAARDGSITPEDLEQLETRLRIDPEARQTYLQLSQLEALLESCPLGELADERSVTATVRPFRRQAMLAWCAAAAVIVVAATMLVQSFVRDRTGGRIALDSIDPVATLIFAEGCEWIESGRPAPSEGERLLPQRLGIRAGTAVIRFDGGAEMLLNGEAEVVLHTAGNGEIVSGETVIRADDGAEGFVLGTPLGEVVDLGTEFAVKVEPSGTSEVHVLEGQVGYGDQNHPKLLRAGHALRFVRGGGDPEEIAVSSLRFAEAISEAKPRPRSDLLSIYEGFDYPLGMREIAQCQGGKGWSSPWRLREEAEQRRPGQDTSAPELSIVSGAMKVPWPVAGGRRGMLELPPGMRVIVRELSAPLDMGRDEVTYFSLMVRETAEPNLEQRYESMRLTFRSSTNYFGPSLSFGYTGNSHPRVELGEGVGFTSLALAPRGQSGLWVGKIVLRGRGEDEIYFRIYAEDETLDYAEPATWHVATRSVSQSAKFDRLLLTSNGSSKRVVDELRIGPTWRSVAPLPEFQAKASR